jgi:hypothetical protein
LVAVGWRVIPRAGRGTLHLAHFDLVGALSATGSLLLLVYSVVEAPTRGWTSPTTITLLAVSVALMTTFIVVEQRHDHPLVRLGILRNPALAHANLVAFAMFGSYAAFQFIATL